MRSAAALAIIIGVSTASAKIDRLVSKRHQKRFLDEAGLYNVTVLHTNDVHAHLDEWRAGRGTDCSANTECISGYARIKQKVNEIRNSTRDVVVLNAGDEFQAAVDFLATGGDFFWIPHSDFIALDTLDEVLVDYLGKNRPLSIQLEGRIVNTTETKPSNGTTNTPNYGTSAHHRMSFSALCILVVACLIVSPL